MALEAHDGPLLGRRREAIGAGVFFLTLGLLFHTPLLGDFFGSSLGGGDLYQFLWDLWHFSHRVLSWQDPLWTDLQSYPLGFNMAYNASMPFIGLLSMPLLPMLGLVGTYNLWLVLSTSLAGIASYGLARSQGHAAAPAVAAGLFFALAPAVTVRHTGHLNLVFAGMIPAGLWALECLLRSPGPRRGVFLGVVSASIVYTDYYFFVYFCLLAGIRLAFALRQTGRREIAALAIAALSSTVLAMPLGLAVAKGYGQFGSKLAQSAPGAQSEQSADLADYLTPPDASLLWGSLVAPGSGFGTGIERQLFLGAACMVLASLGAVRPGEGRARRARWIWVCSGAVFLLLSLGTEPSAWGHRLEGVPTPYSMISSIPVLRGIRVPTRCGIVVALAVSLLAAHGFAALWQWRREAAVVLALLGAAEGWKPGRPLTRIEVPRGIAAAAREPGEFCVLQLPLGWATGTWGIGRLDTREIYFQAVHGKKKLSLSASRGDRDATRSYFLRLPMVQALLGEGRASREAEDGLEILAEGVEFFDVRYVVFEPDLGGLWERMRRREGEEGAQRRLAGPIRGLELTRRYLAASGAKLVSTDAGYEVHRLKQKATPRGGRRRAGSRDATYWFGPGWRIEATGASAPGYLQTRNSPLFIPMSRRGLDYSIELRLWSDTPMELSITDSEGVLGAIQLQTGSHEYRLNVEAARVEEPLKGIYLAPGSGDGRFRVEELGSAPIPR